MDGSERKATDITGVFEPSGSNQSGMRDRNERLVLTILRHQGPLPKAEIARKTGLSAQTVSVIMRALEQDGLLKKGEKVRGKVGQPSVPMGLADDGAYFLGLKVGRRSAELILVDFIGKEIAHITKPYSYPTPAKTLEFVQTAVSEILQKLPNLDHTKIAGMGIASPFFLWEWAGVIGVEPEEMAAWKGFDLAAEIGALFDFPVYLGNDATSACGAELTFGTLVTPADFLYVYIGHFVGGGVVLHGALFAGRSGNAGAIGPFPIFSSKGKQTQLVDNASLIGLERLLAAHPDSAKWSMESEDDWPPIDHHVVEQWLNEAIPCLTQLIVGACSIIDFASVVIDGNMPTTLRDTILVRLEKALENSPMSGLVKPDLEAGTLGSRARPLGAASLPLSKKFMLQV